MDHCFLVDLSQIFRWSNLEDSSPFGYLETGLNATGEYFCVYIIIREIYVMAQYASLLLVGLFQMYL